MTKIFGTLGMNDERLEELVGDMASSMQHEPWHRIDTYKEAIFGCGHISLGKVNPEKQPIWNHDESKCIVMAGKIFDYESDKLELIQKGYHFKYACNDLEYILNSYEEYGKDCFKRLNGIFALAIWDNKTDRLVLANDRFGFRPLFYSIHNHGIAFASEVKALLKDKQISREINWKAWGDFFIFGWIFGNDTYYKDILSLPPASVLEYKNGKTKITTYWDYRKIKLDRKHDETYFISKGANLIEQAIKRQIENLERATCFLTGGYDSRGIAATIKKMKGQKLKVNTYVGCTYNADQLESINEEAIRNKIDFNHKCILEPIISKEVADHLGFEHNIVFCTNHEEKSYFDKWLHITDGMTDAHLWAMNVANRLPQDTFVNFDGAVADVFLKGYFIAQNELKLPSIIYRPMLFLRIFQKEKIDYIKKHFHIKLAKKMIARSRIGFIKELSKIPLFKKTRTFLFFGGRTRRSIALSIYSVITTKTECFCPYLDNDLMNFALSIPPEMMYRQNLYMKMLERIDPDIMKIPSSSNSKNIADPSYVAKIKEAKSMFRELLSQEKEMAENPSVTTDSHTCPIETTEPFFLKWYNTFNT
ncbi:MAG: hypothetical protein JW925_14135 [Syntrophaceae bacterium]|nr:hypothetical protein [Syntrophaceae bacterium]